MNDVKVQIAKALDPILSILLELHGEQLTAVRSRVTDGCLDRIRFQLATMSLVFDVDSDDDTFDIHFAYGTVVSDKTEIDVSNQQPWTDKLGKPFGWSWVAVNQQGYLDGLLLAFGEVVPEIAVTVVASEFKVRVVHSVLA